MNCSAADMKFRMKVSVYDRLADFDRPLALSFKNLAVSRSIQTAIDSLIRPSHAMQKCACSRCFWHRQRSSSLFGEDANDK